MKKIFIAGNWKMYKCKDEALEFIFKINNKVPDKNKVESVIFPQNTLLDSLVQIEGKNLRIGAQNIFYKDEGPYTGEISPKNIFSLGVKYVLLGHYERRKLFNETDEMINLKLLSVIPYNIYPVICIGENLKIKEKNETELFLNNQLEIILKNIDIVFLEKIIFAYEPVWSIGTGNILSCEKANKIIKKIRDKISLLFNEKVAQKVRIIYGGSIDIANVSSFLKQKEIDGILSGKSSLQVEEFLFFTELAEKIFDKKNIF
ncbi:triose-phosphate isomerase [Texas Phoenix palm phytoplasma]|uniref:Triosephosphate isomerase n=1 Tax=Texas Phoenix palm phytoplasma TaxID=176709 RepID=A0ABS5BI48_9MOLU|nr:triose-phosphate isomerase [Texas Phoenix palm phytoplasma]MBP3059259.1 triose-phosphate isomerase [Texas Phoenix palm phytoplasma]